MKKIKHLLKKANEFYDQDRIQEAILVYEQILELDPDEIESLINISDCLIKILMDQKALKYAKKAFDLYRFVDDMAVVNYSSVLIRLKKLDESIQILEDCKKSESTNYLIYNNLGYAFQLKKEFKNALINYTISISLEKVNPLAYCNRGNLKYFYLNDASGISDLELAEKYGDFEASMFLQKVRGNFRLS